MGKATSVCMVCQQPYGEKEGPAFKEGDISHGICPTCAPGFLKREMDDLRAARGQPPREPSALARRVAGD